MKPFDPRLLRYARSSRGFLALGGVLGAVQAIAMIAFAALLATAITQAMAGNPLTALAGVVASLIGVVVVRAACHSGMDWAGARAAATAKSELRGELMTSIAKLGPRRLGGRASAELTTLAGHGLDALDPYFGRYLPQLILTVVAMPLLIAVTLWADPVSGITEIVVLPVIPLFMVLIGWATQRAQNRQLDALTRLATAFVEIIEGLSTLKIFGRARRQRIRVAEITDDYRRSTMKVLRVSFLSGFALELLASIAVALVAVQIGIRLIDRDMSLVVGLAVLVLAPEVFAPIRQVGAQFHAAAEGVAAADRVFEIIQRADALPEHAVIPMQAGTAVQASAAVQAGAAGHTGAVPHAVAGLSLRQVRVDYDGRTVIDGLDLDAPRGAVTALEGESGGGKSTLLAMIRGEIGTGEVVLDGRPRPPESRSGLVSWMGQEPGLISGTVAENVALGRPEATRGQIIAALAEAGLGEIDPELELGVGGEGLSGGQAQRCALARTLLRARIADTPIAVFDEPSSALDADRERIVIAALRALAEEGRVVIVVSHRFAVLEAADRRIRIRPLSAAATPTGDGSAREGAAR